MYDAAISTKDLLVLAGLGSYGGTNPFDIYVGHPPDKPDSVTLINMAGGLNPLPHLLLDYPSVQVMVRGRPSGYAQASAHIAKVCKALIGIRTEILNGDTYRACNQLGGIAYLGQDNNTRPMFVANFRYIVEPGDTGTYRLPIE
jgi:hypothetical protein